jgi:hypothetical protein
MSESVVATRAVLFEILMLHLPFHSIERTGTKVGIRGQRCVKRRQRLQDIHQSFAKRAVKLTGNQ